MRYRLINENGERTFAIVFDSGDEVLAGLRQVALAQNLSAARFTAIGAFSDTVLGFYDLQRRDYKRIEIGEQVEVVSLSGDITRGDRGGATVHAHVVVGKQDGSAHGGHLLSATVRPTLEALLVESPAHLRRRHDPDTGLALIDLQDFRSQV